MRSSRTTAEPTTAPGDASGPRAAARLAEPAQTDLDSRQPDGPRPGSLSIIIPILNEAAEIVAALDALDRLRRSEAAAFPGGIELLVADGGSSDASVALCRGRVDRVLSAARGRARQMNAGAAAAAGELLLFLHVDTRLSPEGLVALATAWSRQRHAGWGRFDVSIRGHSRWFPLIAALMNWRSAWTGIATGDQAIFVRRERFDAVGGFPDQPLMEDIELSKRLLRPPGGAPLRLRQRVSTSGRRWESHGVWSTIVLMWRLRWRYWRGTPADQLAEAYR